MSDIPLPLCAHGQVLEYHWPACNDDHDAALAVLAVKSCLLCFAGAQATNS